MILCLAIIPISFQERMANKNLNKAKEAKKDVFYIQLEDINVQPYQKRRTEGELRNLLFFSKIVSYVQNVYGHITIETIGFKNFIIQEIWDTSQCCISEPIHVIFWETLRMPLGP